MLCYDNREEKNKNRYLYDAGFYDDTNRFFQICVRVLLSMTAAEFHLGPQFVPILSLHLWNLKIPPALLLFKLMILMI